MIRITGTIKKSIVILVSSAIILLALWSGSYTTSYAKGTAENVLGSLTTYAANKDYGKAAEYIHDIYKDKSIYSLGVSSGLPVIKDNGDGTGCGLYQGVDSFPDGNHSIYFYYGGMAGGLRTGEGVILCWSWNDEGEATGYYTFEGTFADDLPNGSGTATEVVYGLYTNITTGTYSNGLENGIMVESQIKEVLEEFEYRDLTYTSVDGVRQDNTSGVAAHIYEQITAYGLQDYITVEEIETDIRNWAYLQGGYVYMYDPNYTNVCNHGFGFDEDDGPFCNYEWCVWTTDGSLNGVRHLAS